MIVVWSKKTENYLNILNIRN